MNMKEYAPGEIQSVRQYGVLYYCSPQRLNDPRTTFVRAFSPDNAFGFQSGKVLFDGLGGYADDFSEFPGGIVGMIFEQSEDYLPTFSSFHTTYSGFLTTFYVGINVGITVGIMSRPDTLYKSFNRFKVLQKVRDFTCVVYYRGFPKGSPLFSLLIAPLIGFFV